MLMTMILSNVKTIRPQCDVKSLLVKEKSKKFIVHSLAGFVSVYKNDYRKRKEHYLSFRLKFL